MRAYDVLCSSYLVLNIRSLHSFFTQKYSKANFLNKFILRQRANSIIDQFRQLFNWIYCQPAILIVFNLQWLLIEQKLLFSNILVILKSSKSRLSFND